MAYREFKVEIEGTRPLIMSSAQGADPYHPLVKEKKSLTANRKKTDDTISQIDRLDFLLSLYVDEDTQKVYLPSDNILANLVAGAKTIKLGSKAKEALIVENVAFTYNGPTDPLALETDANFSLRSPVRQQNALLLKRRPYFKKWSASYTLVVDDSVMSPNECKQIIELAQRKGVGTWRPRYGHFKLTKFEEVTA